MKLVRSLSSFGGIAVPEEAEEINVCLCGGDDAETAEDNVEGKVEDKIEVLVRVVVGLELCFLGIMSMVEVENKSEYCGAYGSVNCPNFEGQQDRELQNNGALLQVNFSVKRTCFFLFLGGVFNDSPFRGKSSV